jgi:hypothetical protein
MTQWTNERMTKWPNEWTIGIAKSRPHLGLTRVPPQNDPSDLQLSPPQVCASVQSRSVCHCLNTASHYTEHLWQNRSFDIHIDCISRKRWIWCGMLSGRWHLFSLGEGNGTMVTWILCSTAESSLNELFLRSSVINKQECVDQSSLASAHHINRLTFARVNAMKWNADRHAWYVSLEISWYIQVLYSVSYRLGLAKSPMYLNQQWWEFMSVSNSSSDVWRSEPNISVSVQSINSHINFYLLLWRFVVATFLMDDGWLVGGSSQHNMMWTVWFDVQCDDVLLLFVNPDVINVLQWHKSRGEAISWDSQESTSLFETILNIIRCCNRMWSWSSWDCPTFCQPFSNLIRYISNCIPLSVSLNCWSTPITINNGSLVPQHMLTRLDLVCDWQRYHWWMELPLVGDGEVIWQFFHLVRWLIGRPNDSMIEVCQVGITVVEIISLGDQSFVRINQDDWQSENDVWVARMIDLSVLSNSFLVWRAFNGKESNQRKSILVKHSFCELKPLIGSHCANADW